MSTTSRRQRPVRVLYCENNTDGTIGGSHHCLLQLVSNLDRERFEPVVIFYDDHALVDRFRSVAETIVEAKDRPVLWGASMPPGSWRNVPVGMTRRAVNLGRLLKKIGRQVAFLRQRQIDLLHLNNSITRQHDWMMAALLTGVPCIVHERGLPAYGAVDRTLGRRLSLIIPVSQWVARAMIAQGVDPANVRVLYDGVDPDRLLARIPQADLGDTWGVAPDQPVFGMVGNIREWKGQETAVRALVDVVRAYPTAVCFFVGATAPEDAAYMARLQRIVADAGIQQNVRFTGYQTDVPSFMEMMRFVIHASIEPEPFGMVVLEAMARQKAVIGSRAGGVVEMVVDGETGFTFRPGDAEELAGLIRRLLDDEETTRQMGQRGSVRVRQHFSLTRYMNQIHDTYEAIMDGRSPVGDAPCVA